MSSLSAEFAPATGIRRSRDRCQISTLRVQQSILPADGRRPSPGRGLWASHWRKTKRRPGIDRTSWRTHGLTRCRVGGRRAASRRTSRSTLWTIHPKRSTSRFRNPGRVHKLRTTPGNAKRNNQRGKNRASSAVSEIRTSTQLGTHTARIKRGASVGPARAGVHRCL